MATPVMMPNVGITVESCILTTWHKKKGDAVKKGDVLFTYETDKSTLDEESPVDGITLEQFFGEDADVPTMTNVCVIGQEGESTAEFAPCGRSRGSCRRGSRSGSSCRCPRYPGCCAGRRCSRCFGSRRRGRFCEKLPPRQGACPKERC